MKKLTYLCLAAALLMAIASCKSDEETWKKYSDWRELNNSWIEEQAAKTEADGSKYYEMLRPKYDQGNYVLAHWFNDREATAANKSPYYTSTVDVKYIGRLYNDEPFDSSYNNTTYGDSIFRTKLNSVITGWATVLQEMHIGDSVEVLIPYQSAYGASSSGTIKPYSNLKFNIKLVGIPYWEARP